MKTHDHIPDRVISDSNRANRASNRAQRALTICAICAMLLCGICNKSAMAIDKSLNLEFDLSKTSFDASNSSFLYEGYQPLNLPSGLQLALQTVQIPLQSIGEIPEVDITIKRGAILGWVDPESFSRVDIPTADDDRYDALKPAVAELFENGFAGALINSVRETAQGAIANLTISPYQIDSSGNVYTIEAVTLRVSSAAQVTIGQPQYGPSAATTKNADLSSNSPYRSMGAGINYLIITNNTLLPEINRLADYKNATGIQTRVALIDDILATYTGIDNAEALRNSLKDYFNDGVTHVLLAGDENIIPIRHAYYYNTSTMPLLENMMVCDLYFADLTGDWDTDGDGIWGEPTDDTPDVTAELHIGRLPISKPAQAKNYIDKLITYESNPGNGDASYLNKTAIYSSDQMRDFSSGGQHAIIADAMPDYYQVDTSRTIEIPAGHSVAPNNDDAAGTIATLDEGFGVVNIIAHGRHDGFAVRSANYNQWPKSYLLSEDGSGAHGSLDQLQANGKIGLYVALSCDLGGFDMDAAPFTPRSQSFVESVISTENSGAVGMVGYSRWGWVYSSYRLHAAFLEHLYSDADGDPIAAMNMSSAEFPYYRDLIYGQNYYGDPTVRIHLGIPKEHALEIVTDDWVGNSIVANVSLKGSASRGSAVSGAKVILSADGVVLAESVTDFYGNANLSHDFELGVDYVITSHPAGGLVQIQNFTPGIVTGVDDDEQSSLPMTFALKQNYPNPFNPSTTIEWDLPRSSHVAYKVIDILGRTVTSADLGRLPAGRHSLTWEAQDDNGSSLASGVYFFQLVTEENIASKKMVLLK